MLEQRQRVLTLRDLGVRFRRVSSRWKVAVLVPVILAVALPISVLTSSPSTASVTGNYLRAAQLRDVVSASRSVCPESRPYVESPAWPADLAAIDERLGQLVGFELLRGSDSTANVNLDFAKSGARTAEFAAPDRDGNRCLLVSPGYPLGSLAES